MIINWYETFLILFSGVMGLILGSFANVLIARLPLDESPVKPASRCPKCLRAIRWYDNLPVLSYLLLRGRCRRCAEPISIRYPVVELLTGLLFVACLMRTGWGPLLWLRDWPLMVIAVSVAFIDAEHRIIPNELSLGGMIWGLAVSWMNPYLGIVDSLLGAAVGFGVFYGVAWLYLRLRGKSGLGGGDIKFLGTVGAFLGLRGVFFTVLIGSVLGSLIGIALGMRSRKSNLMTTSIPFGPFLVIGGLMYFFFGEVMESWIRIGM